MDSARPWMGLLLTGMLVVGGCAGSGETGLEDFWNVAPHSGREIDPDGRNQQLSQNHNLYDWIDWLDDRNSNLADKLRGLRRDQRRAQAQRERMQSDPDAFRRFLQN